MSRNNIGVEAFADGSTYKGTLVSLKAKFQELFVKDFSKNYDSIPHIADILKEISDTKKSLDSASGDGIRKDISYLPIKEFAKHLLKDGKIVKQANQVLKELVNISHYLQIRNDKLLPAWNKFLTEFATSVDKGSSKNDIESTLKVLAIPAFKAFSSNELIGAWILENVHKGIYTGIYTVVYHNYDAPKDVLSLHAKPYTRLECESLLKVCGDIVNAVGRYYFSDKDNGSLFNDELNKLTKASLDKLEHVLKTTENVESLKHGYYPYNIMYEYLFLRSIEHGIEILYTVKAVLRIIQSSIRRF